MLTTGIIFKNFQIKKNFNKTKKILSSLLKEKNHILNSLSNNYSDSYSKKKIQKYKTSLNFKVIGMGGSTLGTQTIYSFLKSKIKKKFLFIDNLSVDQNKRYKKNINLIVSKSGNTIETIVNSNIHVKKKRQKYFYYRK